MCFVYFNPPQISLIIREESEGPSTQSCGHSSSYFSPFRFGIRHIDPQRNENNQPSKRRPIGVQQQRNSNAPIVSTDKHAEPNQTLRYYETSRILIGMDLAHDYYLSNE